MSTNTDKLAEALQDGLSVCNSVSMAAGRRVVIDGCVLYAQTEEWCQWAKKEVRPRLQTALNAHDAEQAAQAVPAGFKWVPVEPTLEMLTAAVREDDKAFVDGMPHGATAADVWAVMLASAPAAPAPEAPPDTDAVTACWQDFGRTEESRRAVKWLQDGEIPGALFVAFRAGLRAASPKSLCDCGKKPAAECDKWEPGCDLGQSPEHARVVRVHVKAQAAGQYERAVFGAWFEGYRHGWKSEKDVAFDAWQARAALAQRQPLTEQQIMDGWRDECPPSASLDVFTDGVMFAERAHGIGATTGEQNK